MKREFYEADEKASGLSVIPETANFYRVLSSVKIATAAAARHIRTCWWRGSWASYTLMDNLRQKDTNLRGGRRRNEMQPVVA